MKQSNDIKLAMVIALIIIGFLLYIGWLCS